MDIRVYSELPQDVLNGVKEVHRLVFEGSEFKEKKLVGKPAFLAVVSFEDAFVTGFKFGYEHEDGVFYSWLGGVHPTFQGLGIASQLMLAQHKEACQLGYKRIRTFSQNHRKTMMIANLKHGFDIVHTFVDEKGRHKIVFEKDLT